MYQHTYLIRDIWECPADLMTILTSVKGLGAVKGNKYDLSHDALKKDKQHFLPCNTHYNG